MEQKIDLQAVRAFSYAICGMFLVIPVRAFLTIPVMGLFGRNGYQALRGLLSFGIILYYVSNMAILVCLYRLGVLTRYFRYAQTFFAGWIFLNLFTQIFLWFWDHMGIGSMSGFFSGVLSLLPGIFLMAGTVFILNGLRSLCREMEQEEEEKAIVLLRKCYIIFQVIRFLFLGGTFALFYAVDRTAVSGMEAGSSVLTVFAGIFLTGTILSVAAYELAGMHIFLKVKEICQKYYQYAYKKQYIS